MLIAILICLLSDTRAVEQFRFERLQGQCSAWCYETYGTLAGTPAPGTNGDEIEVFQCLNNGTDQDCHDCDIGCSYEFNNKRECYSRCNEKPACKAACGQHETLSRELVDFDALNNSFARTYPHDVYEDIRLRNYTTIVLYWSHVKQFSDPRAVVFVLFLLNYTSDDPNEDPQGLYIGHTPHFSFVAEPLSQNYCYGIRVLTVTTDKVVGIGVSSNKFITDAIINADNVTSTSANIWFQTRACADHVTYTVQLMYDLKHTRNNYIELESPPDMENVSTYRIRAPDLIPDQVYRVRVLRKMSHKELFPYHGEFKTLPAAPGTDVTISLIAGVSATNITYTFGITDDEKLYDETISYYMMRINQTGEPITLRRVESRELSSTEVVTGLTPYTRYCVSMAVANPLGLGPFSGWNCSRTLSAPAGPPSLRLLSVTTNGAVILATRPDPPKGQLVRYYITYIHHNALVEVNVTLTEGHEQNVILEGLESHTEYTVNVAAVNSKGQVGVAAPLHITTPQSVPEAAPLVSSCDLFSNSTHVSAKVSWISVKDWEVNGELQLYFLNLLQLKFVDGKDEVVNNQTYNFTLQNATQEVIEVTYEDIILDYSVHETVSARLAISTYLGVGPWSQHFLCTIADPVKMGVDAIQILVIVICIIALFVFVLGAFFYFFRFKTYKKTPYEEIKKLIRPDTFSPCQHCMHNKDPKRWDVFICHVSEDTDYIVQLKEAFVREKIDVFFAKDELSWGCELHRVINDGLRDSKYGLVVLSKQFVNKCSKWTSSELSSLHSKSRLSSQDCILPIWKKDITELEVGAFDMTLVGIKALKEDEMTVDQMAVELKKKLRNDGCWGCSMRKLNNQTSSGSTPKSEDAALLGVVPQDAGSDYEGTNV